MRDAGCPSCIGRRGSHWGFRDSSRIVLRDGALMRETVRARRMRCGCGHVWTIAAPDCEETGHALVQAVVTEGVAGAAGRLSTRPSIVRRIVRRHLRALDRDAGTELPEILGLRIRASGGQTRTIVSDEDDEILVAVLDSPEGLEEWATARREAPRIVAVEFEPAVRRAVESVWPASEIAVAPGVAAAAFEAAARRSFDGIEDGRNNRPDAASCFVPDEGLDADHIDAVSMWSASRKAYRRAVLAVLDGFSFPGRLRTRTDEALAILSSVVPRSGVVRLLEEWRGPFAVGTREPGLDGMHARMTDLIEKRARVLRVPSGTEAVHAVLVHGFGSSERETGTTG